MTTQAMNQIDDIDAAIESCERMYSASFRSEAFKLGSIEGW